MMRSLLPLSLLLCVSACSDGARNPGDDGPGDAATQDDWLTVVEGDWSLPAGDEGYVCVRTRVKETVYVHGFSAIAPLGTHHTLLTVEPESDAAEETFDCNAGVNGPNMVYGSGVGTDPIEFPDGVAIKLEAGSTLLLNLHLYNTGTEEITGRSGVRAQVMPAAEVENEAEIILAGKVGGLTVVPGQSTQTGGCKMSHDTTIFMAAPHMHQLGAHMKAVAHPTGADPRVLFDAPYSFDEQVYYQQSPSIPMKAGDRVAVECGYDNPTGQTVAFGDSSDMEMCFTGLYRYPKGEGAGYFICTEEGGFGGPTEPCANKGDEGNDEGVGRLCSAGGNECDAGMRCLLDVLPGDFGNFCTKACETDTDCGEGAGCFGSGSTSACIPTACTVGFGPSGDAGAD